MPSAAVERVLVRLEAAECNPRGNVEKGWDAKCPSHEDRNPSFHLAQGSDGKALVTCYKGCSHEEIAAALWLEVGDLFEPEEDEPDPARPAHVVERYAYTDEHGKVLYEVERLDPKGFRQRQPKGRDWTYNLRGVNRVPYHLPQLIAAVKAGALIHIVEGEKDVHTLEARGKVATTFPGGAGKWRDDYACFFKGAKVAVIQDIDPPDKKTNRRPGQEHAAQVAEALTGVAEKVKVFQPAVGRDVTEHLEAGLTLGQLQEAGEIRKPRLEVLTCQEIMALPDPDVAGNLLGPLIYRGHRMVVGGHTGHGKTTFTMHMVASAVYGRDFLEWTGQGDLRALVIDVEQGTKTIKRVLRETHLDESKQVKYLRVPHGLALDRDPEMVMKIERFFHDGGFDIVLADPLYKLHTGDPNDSRAADDLMRRFDEWRERYGFALILPMHCRKPHPHSKLSSHDLFGSSTYQWGAEMLLGIERKSDNFSWLHFWKDRDGEVVEIAPLNGHWQLSFERDRGFYRAETRERGPSTQDRVYALLRDEGPLTSAQIHDYLFRAMGSAAPKMGPIYNALKRLGDTHGVTHNGQHLLKDRVYQLPMAMFAADEALTNPESDPR